MEDEGMLHARDKQSSAAATSEAALQGAALCGESAGTRAPRQQETAGSPPEWLTVGPQISLSGEIAACDRLVVQGSVQVSLKRTRCIEVAESGRFTKGRAEVDEAEIAGIYEGELTVRRRLLIRATGRVGGTVRYGEIEIEPGGQLTGSISVMAGPG
jgi:cytoskeletal protein CcmA (bactofilin family)